MPNAPTILQICRYEKYINDILSISISHINAILKKLPSEKKTFLLEEGWHGEAVTEGVHGVNRNRRIHLPKRPSSAKKTSLFEGGGTAKP